MDGLATRDGEAVLAEAAAAYRDTLGPRLLAAYALGSLAHGGFSPLVSDVDLGLVIDDPPRRADARLIRAVIGGERSKGSQLHQRLSVFWGTPETLAGERAGGRFPALDRLDLLEHGRLLAGDEQRHGLARPSPEELLVEEAQFALSSLFERPRPTLLRPRSWPRSARGRGAVEIRSPQLLLARGVRRMSKVALFPVRSLFTAATGRVDANDVAVARYLEHGEGPSGTLVAAALRWRTSRANAESAGELLQAQLLPLYLHYMDEEVARLGDAGRGDLAAAFARWRGFLLRRPLFARKA